MNNVTMKDWKLVTKRVCVWVPSRYVETITRLAADLCRPLQPVMNRSELVLGAEIEFETSVGIVYGVIVPAHHMFQKGDQWVQVHDRFWVEFDDRNRARLNQLYHWSSAVVFANKPDWIQIGLADGAYGGPEYRIRPCINRVGG